VFFASTHGKQGEAMYLDLFQAVSIAITRHIKIRADATPYDPAFTDYFVNRQRSRKISPLAWDGMVA
jgi:RNA-directed DNA polymerase